MPRNVVTLTPRWHIRPSRRATQERVTAALAERYRYRAETDPPRIEIDFPKSKGRATAKEEVAAVLDAIDPNWRRLFVLYPTENSLGRRWRGETLSLGRTSRSQPQVNCPNR